MHSGGVPGGPVVKNPPYNVGGSGLIPGWGAKIPHVVEQLSPCTTPRESLHHSKRSHMMQPNKYFLKCTLDTS